jgi:hypothetical protein
MDARGKRTLWRFMVRELTYSIVSNIVYIRISLTPH